MEYNYSNNKNVLTTLSKLAIIPLIILIIILMVKFKITLNTRTLANFSAIFISIVLEAMPFIFIGSLISSLIQIFVSEQTIARILPRNHFLALLCASLLGIFLPICECGIIPIAKKLIKKGVPVGVATTFMISTPIINPIVLLSTYYAFGGNLKILSARAILGVIASIIIGSLITIINKSKTDVLKETDFNDDDLCGCGVSHNTNKKNQSKISLLLDTIISEFLDISKYLIFGAMLSATFQVLVSRSSLNYLASNLFLSVIAMIFLAFILSVCSEADAFIAASFIGQFTTGSILAFLIFGPMLDIKNTLMLIGGYKKTYVIPLILCIIIICASIGFGLNLIGFKVI
ncbi:permease [Clostridium sp. YIM B02551]|uniref:permease n=1 Tax=Clostridium sp. YIM B02551 TaxID=2910679 RepID=UPI001EEACE3D|nr:permease [Clostridium sp. YIM B02551]